MRRDENRRKVNNQSKRPLRFVVGGILLLVVTFTFFFLQHHAIKSPFTSIKLWFSERKNHLKTSFVKVKKIAISEKKPALPVHFEFYTALPNMQVTVDSPESVTQAVNQIHQAKPETIANAVTNAGELEQQFEQALAQSHYVIQLGVFTSAEAAERYKMLLKNKGFSVVVIRLTKKKITYRVQLGPFLNKDQAYLTQHELQKQGFGGIVRKV